MINNYKKADDEFLMKDVELFSPTLLKHSMSCEYTMFLDKTIISVDQIMEHLDIYKNATPDDIILLNINSLGGSVSVGQVYIQHMRQCQAPIIGIVGMDCASEAAAIAMCCDDLIFDEMSTMLIHQFSYGNLPTTANDIYRTAKFNKELNKRWVDHYFSELLTSEEYDRLMSDQDVLLNSDQLKDRWANIMSKRESKNLLNQMTSESQSLGLYDESL